MPISEVHNCDCMEYMATIPDKFFELAVVDPPYGNERLKNPKGSLERYGDSRLANNEVPNQSYFNELFRVSKKQIIWGYNYYANLLPNTNGFIFWYKHQPVDNYSDGELAWTSFLKNSVCFDYPYYGAINKDKNRIHPTQKPIALYGWILQNYAEKGDKIFDSHLGSGSSRIAAYKLGFDFYACEINKNYFDDQNDRFRKDCLGEFKLQNGKTAIQQSLFEL